MIIFLHDTKTTALPGGIIGEKTNSDRKIWKYVVMGNITHQNKIK